MRPGIIVSHNQFNSAPKWKSVTIIPLTSSERWLIPGSSAVIFEAGESGLTKRCAALAHQVTTIDKSKCVGFIGKCTIDKLRQIEKSLLNYLDITVSP